MSGHRPKEALRAQLHDRLAGQDARRDRAARRDRNAHDQPARSVDVRSSIVARLSPRSRRPWTRRTPISPRERLNENPSRWYLTGFLAPAEDPLAQDGRRRRGRSVVQEEMEIDVEEPDDDGAGGAAGDEEPPEAPSTKRRFLPSSVGLTVLLPSGCHARSRPSLLGRLSHRAAAARDLFLPDDVEEIGEDGKRKRSSGRGRMGARAARNRSSACRCRRRGNAVVVPESAAEQRAAAASMLETHARLFTCRTPDGDEQVRALTVFLVNRRAPVHRFYADVSFAFQARLELVCAKASGRGATSPATRPTTSTCASPICTIATSANGRWAATPPPPGTTGEEQADA